MSDITKFVIFIIMVASLIAMVASMSLYKRCREAQVINKTYGTNYSMGDMVWANSTIKEICEGKKLRIELK